MSMTWQRTVWTLTALAGVVLLVEVAAGPGRSAGDEGKASDEAALPADLGAVPADGVAFASVRLAELWNKDATQGLRERLQKDMPGALDEWRQVIGLPPGDIERFTVAFPHLEMGPGPYPLFFVETARPYDRDAVLKAVAPEAKEEKVSGQTLYVGSRAVAVHFLSDRAYVVSGAGAVRELLDRPAPRREGPLAAALREAAGSQALVAGLNPEPVVEQIGDKLPPQAEAFRPLLKTRLATLVVDADRELNGTLRLDFPGDKDAREAKEALETGLGFVRAGLEQLGKQAGKEGAGAARFAALLEKAEAGLKDVAVKQDGSHLTAAVHVKTDLAGAAVLVDEGIVRTRQAAGRAQSANNLKQLALAMHNYADSHQSRFPPQAVYSKDGKPLLSWRVLILPYIEQDALFKEFHLDEPWDSEHNKALLARMPRTYALAGQPMGATETYYQGFVGKGAFFEGKQGQRLPQDFPDGTSNTVMFVEAAKAVPWTKPDDLPYDPDPTRPLPRLGGHFRGGFNAALCDGSVHFVSSSVGADSLRAAITRNGGDAPGPDF